MWLVVGGNCFSHNHGSGNWLYLKGNNYWRDPFFTSMTMGGKVCRRVNFASFSHVENLCSSYHVDLLGL